MHTAQGAWGRTFAFRYLKLKRDGGVRGRLWRWEAIAMDSDSYPVREPEKKKKKKKLVLERLSTFRNRLQASPILPLPSKNIQNVCCTIISIGEGLPNSIQSLQKDRKPCCSVGCA